MCCGLYFHLLLKWLLALSPAYFCNACACWPTLSGSPRLVSLTRMGALWWKHNRKADSQHSELHRGLHIFRYENLVVMVLIRNHSPAQNHHPLCLGYKLWLGTKGTPVLLESRQGNSFAGANPNQIVKGACSVWSAVSWVRSDWETNTQKLRFESNCLEEERPSNNSGSLASHSPNPD